jgi:hypothetical protein
LQEKWRGDEKAVAGVQKNFAACAARDVIDPDASSDQRALFAIGPLSLWCLAQNRGWPSRLRRDLISVAQVK